MLWNDFEKQIKKLPDYTPRDGFEQRFWARAQRQPGSRVFWRWLPVAATAVGLMIGLAAGQAQPTPMVGTQAVSGLTAEIGISQNSLAGLFGRSR